MFIHYIYGLQVLVSDNSKWLEWETMKERDEIPENAVVGGTDENGDDLFIGRVSHGKSVTVGKVF
jgi:hypothetical protein